MKLVPWLKVTSLLIVFGGALVLGSHACKTSSSGSAESSEVRANNDVIKSLKAQGYTIVETNKDPIDYSFFKKWSPELNTTDDDDQIKEHKLEGELWAAVHDTNTLKMNTWLHDAGTFMTFNKNGDGRFPRINVIQPFGCLRSFADGYYNQIFACAWLEGEQGWKNSKNGRLYQGVLPLTSANEGSTPHSTNINTWVMRYSMVSFRHLITNQAEKAIQSLEYQVRLGVEGRASAAFTYAIIRHDAKIRIQMPDGRLLTPLERSLDILQNCDDTSSEYHDKTCRHASPLAPHKFSGMLFSLAEIQGRAAGVLKKPEIKDQSLVEKERVELKKAMEKTLALLQSTETEQGFSANLDPAIKDFASSKNIVLRPWAFAKHRENMVATLPAKIARWIGEEGIPLINNVGLVAQPLPEYAKGEACINCHYQGNETFNAGYKPQW